MKTRTHRVLAILMGIAILVTLVVQIWHDDRHLKMKSIGNLKTINK